MSIISFLVSLLLFISFNLRSDEYRKIGYLGILYSSVGIIFYLLRFIDIGNSLFFYFFLSLIFLFLVFLLSKDLHKIPIFPNKKFPKEKSYIVLLLSHLIFVVTLVNFIFIGTVAVHELGHFSVSKFSDCEYRKIVYENDFFHTEILCKDIVNKKGVLLGGILSPILLALLLFFIGGNLMKEIGFLILGFNFLSLSKDLGDLGLSSNFSLISVILGIIFLGYGVFLLIKYRTEEDIYIPKLGVSHSLNLKRI